MPRTKRVAKNARIQVLPAQEAADSDWRFLILACLVSGLFLALCYAPFQGGFLAWFALVPLLLALERTGNRVEAFFCGCLTGILFFGISLSWLIHVSTFGWMFLFTLEALFFSVFCLAVFESRKINPPWLRVFWIALAWTAMELIRSETPVFAMGWNLLAYSQAENLKVLQLASLFGAYGLGFVIVIVNTFFAEIILQFFASKNTKPKNKLFLGTSVLGLFLIFTLLWGYGSYRLKPISSEGDEATVKVSVIQGNIPQEIKWVPVARTKILEIYKNLTTLAAQNQPDLIVWPEAAFPGYFNIDYERDAVYDLVRKSKTSLLVGSPHYETKEATFNSAYFIGPEGLPLKRYDKQHLVPFGEYIPFKFIFGWLEPIAQSLGVSNFVAGDDATVFDLLEGKVKFSTLICFEDSLPGLAREFVDRGAQFLAVITNDAWFGRSGAAAQHLQASIFRAVENAVPVVRAANTGISGFISSRGEVIDRVRGKSGEDIFVLGHKTLEIPLHHEKTFYREFGWMFSYLCAVLFFVFGFMLLKRRT